MEEVHHIQEVSLGRILDLATTPCTRVPRITSLTGSRAESVRLSATQARSRHHPGVHSHRHRVSRLQLSSWGPGSVITVPSLHLPIPPLRLPSHLPPPSPRPVHRTTQLSLSKPCPSLLPRLLHLQGHSRHRVPQTAHVPLSHPHRTLVCPRLLSLERDHHLSLHLAHILCPFRWHVFRQRHIFHHDDIRHGHRLYGPAPVVLRTRGCMRYLD